eukprot:273967_1
MHALRWYALLLVFALHVYNLLALECQSLNLSNTECERQCIYYNNEKLYFNFITNSYNLSAILLDTNISNINVTLLNQTLRWYSLSTYPHQYYPSTQPDICSYSLGTYCNVQYQQTMIHGFCIPTHCKHEDAVKILKANVAYQSIINSNYNENDIICSRKAREFSQGTYIVLTIFILLLLFILMSTIMKQYSQKSYLL